MKLRLTKTLALGLIGALTLAGTADAAWLKRQPKKDPVHKAVAQVAASGCTVSAADWDRIYAALGGTERDGDYHILKMYMAGELTSQDGGGHVTFTGVAGC